MFDSLFGGFNTFGSVGAPSLLCNKCNYRIILSSEYIPLEEIIRSKFNEKFENMNCEDFITHLGYEFMDFMKSMTKKEEWLYVKYNIKNRKQFVQYATRP